MFKFITLSNGKTVQAFYEADEDQISKIAGAQFDFKELTDGKTAQKIAFVDADGNKIEIFKAPFNTDLDTWHKNITTNNFAESIVDLPAKFLPRVADLNGANDTLVKSGYAGNLDGASEVSFLLRFKMKDVAGSQYLLSIPENTSGANGININLVGSELQYGIVTGAASAISGEVNQTGILADQLYNVVLTYDGVTLKGFVDGSPSSSPSHAVTLGAGISAASNQINIGRFGTAGLYTNMALFDVKIYSRAITSQEISDYNNGIAISNTGLIASYIPTGQGTYDYDISGNSNHVTWAGTGSRFTYDLQGSLYPNTNGYSLWEHATSDPIQVPFDVDGNPLSLTPGTDIPTGYTKTRDVVAGGNKWNMADALVGFNETESANTALEIFDRLNATRQTAASRASAYYDATNLATRSRYQVNEIADPRIYDTYFEAAYKDFVFGKVVLDGTDLIRYDEQLNYATVKAGADLITVEEYCGIDSIYP